MIDFELITDIYFPFYYVINRKESEADIVAKRMEGAFLFTKDREHPYRLDHIEGEGESNNQDIYDLVADLLQYIIKQLEANGSTEPKPDEEWGIEFNGKRFRGHFQPTITGMELNLRYIPEGVPLTSELLMPNAWKELLLNPDLLKGGLIMIVAETGQGKTTVSASVLRERLETFGRMAWALEDPNELMLHGWWKKGFCFQCPITKDYTFSQALVGAMRSYPATTGNMLYIGEVRDSSTASELLMAAVNGHLVMVTIHAGTIQEAMKRLISKASQTMSVDDARGLLASSFRLGVRLQKQWNPSGNGWKKAIYNGEVLYSSGGETKSDNGDVIGSHPVAKIIEEGKFSALVGELSNQKNMIEAARRDKRDVLPKLRMT